MNQGTSITDANSEQLKPLSNEQDILDLLNNAIFDCRNIKTLLSNSKSSIFLPSILDDKHISSISISALQPDSFFLQWDYYDDLFYENHCQFVMKTDVITFQKMDLEMKLGSMIQEGAHISLRMNITVTLKKKKCFALNINTIVKLSKIQ